MRVWSSRPAEVAHLLNPAYCALILRNFVAGYMKKGVTEVDSAVLFLVLPMILHKDTRMSLPGSVATKLHVWVEEHPSLQIGFAQRCKSLVPFTKEALVFACRYGILSVNENGWLVSNSTKKLTAQKLATSEVHESLDAAYFAGRWFGSTGLVASIYSVLGLRP